MLLPKHQILPSLFLNRVQLDLQNQRDIEVKPTVKVTPAPVKVGPRRLNKDGATIQVKVELEGWTKGRGDIACAKGDGIGKAHLTPGQGRARRQRRWTHVLEIAVA